MARSDSSVHQSLLAGQTVDSSSVLPQARFKQSQEEERDSKVQAGDTLISLSSSTSTSSSGLHKQKSFDFVEIATAGDSSLLPENATAASQTGNITAYREVNLQALASLKLLRINIKLCS